MIDELKRLLPSKQEDDYHERRRRVHELSVQVAKLGILKPSMVTHNIGEWFAAMTPLASWDVGVMTKLVIHLQLFAGSISELGTAKHQHWIDKAHRGDIIGGFAMFVTRLPNEITLLSPSIADRMS